MQAISENKTPNETPTETTNNMATEENKSGTPRTKPTYTGPVTGHVYDLAGGERIDVIAEGLSYTGDKASPNARIGGRDLYKRIFIRLRTPEEVLTHTPIKDGSDFARRAAVLEQWFGSHVAGKNVMLLFEAIELSEEDAQALTANQPQD